MREGVGEQREAHMRAFEWALHVGLSRHSDISVHKWSTLQGRPTHVSPQQHSSIPILACTFLHIHFSYQNTHLHHHDLSVLDCLLGWWGEGREKRTVAASIPSLTCLLVAIQPQYESYTVLSALNGVLIFKWSRYLHFYHWISNQINLSKWFQS